MRPLRAVLALALCSVVTSSAWAQPASAITVYIVRHAEKGPQGADPSLTDVGETRAKDLARMLADAGIKAIYASEFKRTQETATPLAKEVHIAPTVIGAAKLDDLIGAVKSAAPGSGVLVVSHSNIVPLIVEKLSGQKIGELTDADYDRLYVVTVTPQGASVVYLHYGASPR